MIKRIVLTGGPCAGKTTALAKIEQDLTERGYKVLIVSESATELIRSGVIPSDKDGLNLVEFQQMILIYQLQKEMLYDEIASKFKHDKIVILYDRGLLDNRAYVSDEEFEDVLNYASICLKLDLKEKDIINRYDAVLHLVTSAKGNSKNYTLENNKARTETVNEAIKLDTRTMECWALHDNLQIIDSYNDFDEKINKILNTIHLVLGNPIPTKKERKFLVDKLNFNLKGLNYVKTNIEQYYISTSEYDKYERRLRKTTYKDGVNYYYSIQYKEKNGIKKVIHEQKVSKKEFYDILNSSKLISNTNKERYTFIYNNQYFKLDLIDDLTILEIIDKSDNKEIDIPSNFSVIKEVTDDNNYQNVNIGMIRNKVIKKIKQ